MVVVISLKEMIVSVVFGYIQLVLVDVIVDFGIDRRFESRHK
jgi:hypothetical protein